MQFLVEIMSISPRFAEWVQGIAEEPFAFSGEYPLAHSAYNHKHLSMLEYMADYHRSIDLAFRCRLIDYIFDAWKRRLKGYRPYQTAGFRVYLYEDMAPTVSVVAETPYGFPYGGEPSFVHSPADVMKSYVGRSWQANFQADLTDIGPEEVIKAISLHNGSISQPAANALDMTVADLRRSIEIFDIQEEVNRLRKKFGRRPAHFYGSYHQPHRFKVYELRLPPKY